MTANTRKVVGRRDLKYASYEELLADLDRLSSGHVKALGNWTEGQIYRHLAIVINGSIDGLAVRFPSAFRVMARIFKKVVLKGPMPPGFQISPENAKVLAPGPCSAEMGRDDLRTAIYRLSRESNRTRHPLFGNITKEEWDSIHLAHASLHMSFLVPQ